MKKIFAILLLCAVMLPVQAQKKIRVVQWGVTHPHADAKMLSLKLLKDQFEIVGYVDDRPAVSPYYIDPKPSVYEGVKKMTPEEVLADDSIDAVVIEASDNGIADIAIKCAQKGLAMHVDKPATDNHKKFEKMVNLCRDKNLPLQMGYMLRGNPGINFIEDIIKKGWLGEIYSIDGNMNLGYGGERWQEYLSGYQAGMMFIIGCHLIDTALIFMDGQAPDKVVPFIKTAPGDPAKFDGNICACVLEWPNCLATLKAYSRHGNEGTGRRGIRVSGTKGSVELKPLERCNTGIPLILELYLSEPCGEYPAGHTTVDLGLQGDRYEVMLKEFAQIVRGELPNPTKWYDHDILVHKLLMQACKK